MSKLHPLILILILLSLLSACRKDDKSYSGQRTLEEKYFEDYVSPDRKWGFINTMGEIAIKPKFDAVLPFSEGAAGVNFRGKWGFIDQEGNYLIEPQFMNVGSFINASAIARNFQGQYGTIDRDGRTIVPFTYDDLRQMGLYYVCSRGRLKGLLNHQGKIIFSPSYDNVRVLSDSLVAVKDRKGWFVKHTAPDKALECGPYEELFEFSEGLASFQLAGKWGFLDKRCQTVIRPEFGYAESFHSGLAAVMDDDSYYLVNKRAEKISGPFLYIQWLNGAWGAQTGEKWLLIDTKGEVLSTRGYDSIYAFSEGLAPVLKGDRWGYIDTTGEERIPGVFVIPWSFKEGKARIMTPRGMQFLNARGEILKIAPRNEYRDFSNGFAAFQE